MKYLTIGSKVLVHIPQGDRQSHTPVMKYHGNELIVANRVVIGHSNNVYYELLGAESDEWHIPYAFIKEWLVQI